MDPSVARYRLLFAISSAIALASLIALAAVLFVRAEPRADSAGLAAEISEKFARLDLKPRSVAAIPETAMQVRNAIRQGDFETARRIAADVLARSRLEAWRYYPFDDFIGGIADVNDAAFGAQLDKWVAAAPNDPLPLLVRAQYYCVLGWYKRGQNFVTVTRSADMAAFTTYMGKSRSDIDAVIKLDARIPYTFWLRLATLRGSGVSQQLSDAFSDAVARYPTYYPLYDVFLAAIEPRWGGSLQAMYGFVDKYAGNAPEYSPLKLLYISLYRDLLGSATVPCYRFWRDRDKMALCVGGVMKIAVTPQLEEHILTALRLYDHSDSHQFTSAMWPIVTEMLETGGGDIVAGEILQLIASNMHSNTQLSEEQPTHNNYLIDDAVALSWYYKGFYDNAVKKDREALTDIESAPFPDEAEKESARAEIYDHLALIYGQQNEYVDTIVYAKASLAVGGGPPAAESYICYSYSKLKQYDAAVASCTRAIDGTGHVPSRYWRGVAYRDLGQIEEAVRDLTAVADSEDGIRINAAIDLSVIYDNRGEFQMSLDVLNKYTYLYDPSQASKSDIAVSYNNRCYAYMKLGLLKRALDDCDQSLKYGDLPDAYRKQQELISRINAHETGL